MISLIYILLCFIWGSTWLAIKFGLEDAPPLWSAGIRFLLATLIVLAVNWVRKAVYPDNLRETIRIALPGLIIYSIPYMMIYTGEQYISSALTAVLFASFPFFVAIYSIFLLKTEKPTIFHWLGLIIGFSGVIAVFYDSLMTSQFTFLGCLLIVGGAAVSAMGTVVLRARYQSTDFAIMLGLQIAAGAIMTIPIALIFEPLSAFHITVRSTSALLYLTVFGSVVAFSGYYWLIKKITALSISLIAFITPVLAVILGYLFLSETFSAFTAVGGLLILGGMILVMKK